MEVNSEILWFNQSICIGKQTLYLKDWHEKGVKYLKDVMREDGRFLSFSEFCRKFDIHTYFTQYYGILEAIPVTWKRIIRSHFGAKTIWYEDIRIKIGHISYDVLYCACNTFYKYFQGEKFVSPIAKIGW